MFIILEAIFTFYFWAYRMVNEDTIYRDMYIGPWDRGQLPYDGLCSHTPLNEGAIGQFDLTPEQRKAHAEELSSRQKALKMKSYQKIKAADPIAFRARAAEVTRRLFKKNPERVKANFKRSVAKSVATKRHFCALCDHAYSTKDKLDAHLLTPSHRERAGLPLLPYVPDPYRLTRDKEKWTATKKTIYERSVAEKKYYCALCDLACPDNTKLDRHKKTTKHKDRAALLEAVGVMDDVPT